MGFKVDRRIAVFAGERFAMAEVRSDDGNTFAVMVDVVDESIAWVSGKDVSLEAAELARIACLDELKEK